MDIAEIEKKVYEHDKDIAVMVEGYMGIKNDIAEIKESVKEIKATCGPRSGGLGEFLNTKMGQVVLWVVISAFLSYFGFNTTQINEIKKEMKASQMEEVSHR